MPKLRDEIRWHPLMNAEERTPGVWTMVDSTGREYGTVRIVREAGALVYASELRGQMLGGRNVRLRDAVEKVHAAFVRSFNDTPVRARRPYDVTVRPCPLCPDSPIYERLHPELGPRPRNPPE